MEKSKAIDLYREQTSDSFELYDKNTNKPDNIAPLGQYQLYGTHYSGYLSFEIYGHVSTWDEDDHLRNKEVKDKKQ